MFYKEKNIIELLFGGGKILPIRNLSPKIIESVLSVSIFLSGFFYQYIVVFIEPMIFLFTFLSIDILRKRTGVDTPYPYRLLSPLMGTFILSFIHLEYYSIFFHINKDTLLFIWLLITIILLIISVRTPVNKLISKIDWNSNSKTAKTYRSLLVKEEKKDNQYSNKYFIDPKKRKFMSVKKVWKDNAIAETIFWGTLTIMFLAILFLILSTIFDIVIASSIGGYLIFNGTIVAFGLFSNINEFFKKRKIKKNNKKEKLFSEELSDKVILISSFNKSIKFSLMFCIFLLSIVIIAIQVFLLFPLNDFALNSILFTSSSLIILGFYIFILSNTFYNKIKKYFRAKEQFFLQKNIEIILLISLLYYILILYIKDIKIKTHFPDQYYFIAITILLFLAIILILFHFFSKKEILTQRRENIIWVAAILYLIILAILSDPKVFFMSYYFLSLPIIVFTLFLNILFSILFSVKKEYTTKDSFTRFKKSMQKNFISSTLAFLLIGSVSFINWDTFQLSRDVDILWISFIGIGLLIFYIALIAVYLNEKRMVKSIEDKAKKVRYNIPIGLKGPFSQEELFKKCDIDVSKLMENNAELYEINY